MDQNLLSIEKHLKNTFRLNYYIIKQNHGLGRRKLQIYNIRGQKILETLYTYIIRYIRPCYERYIMKNKWNDNNVISTEIGKVKLRWFGLVERISDKCVNKQKITYYV